MQKAQKHINLSINRHEQCNHLICGSVEWTTREEDLSGLFEVTNFLMLQHCSQVSNRMWGLEDGDWLIN
jgi:hypothetical protein